MNIRHLLTQTVTVAAYTSANGYGEPGYGPQRPIPARVEVEDGVQNAGEGEEATVTATIYTAERIGPQDRVWLPGTDTSSVSAARKTMAADDAVPLRGSTPDFYVTKV